MCNGVPQVTCDRADARGAPTDRLAGIRVPTLVLAAESDSLRPPESSRPLHDRLSVAEWAVVPGGHAAMWVSTTTFNAAIVDFVDRH